MKIDLHSSFYHSALSIRREVFIFEQHVPEELEIDEFELSCDHFLISKDGQPATTGRLRVKGDFIKFERIATLKKFRRLGLGSVLMKEMLAYASMHYPDLKPYMHAQLDVVSFYEKLGWSTHGEVFYEAGIPHRAMRKI